MSPRIGGIGGYAIAFSLTGLLLYALQLLPNIIWLATPPANDVLKYNSSPHAALNLVEQVFGIATVALLIIVITRAGTEGRNSSALLVCAAVSLVGYYAAWVLYYRGKVSSWLLVVGIAAMPPLYYPRGGPDEGLLCAHSLCHFRHCPCRDHLGKLRPLKPRYLRRDRNDAPNRTGSNRIVATAGPSSIRHIEAHEFRTLPQDSRGGIYLTEERT